MKIVISFIALSLISLNLQAQPPGKVDVCHNGSTTNPDTLLEEPISFIINISQNAVPAHLRNHEDCATLIVDLGEGQECELQDDGTTLVCETVTLCECMDEEAL